MSINRKHSVVHEDAARRVDLKNKAVNAASSRDTPLVFLAEVSDFDTVSGMALVSAIGFPWEGFALPVFQTAGTAGTHNPDLAIKESSGYRSDFHDRIKKRYGNKDYRQTHGGVKHRLHRGETVVVLSQLRTTDLTAIHLIIGSIGYAQYESLVGTVIESASEESRLGNNDGQIEGRVSLKATDFIDEVGYSASERDKMAEPRNAKNRGESIPFFLRPDTVWEVRVPAGRKPQRQDTGFGYPQHSDGPSFLEHDSLRFAGRERLDARRLRTKYHLGETEVEIDEVEEVVLERLFHFDEQGKIILACDTEGTVVECTSCDAGDYQTASSDFDRGSFISQGRAAGIRYMEISARDWMFQSCLRGITRVNDVLRMHVHSMGSDGRTLGNRTDLNGDQTEVEEWLTNLSNLPPGTLSLEEETLLINAYRLQIIAGGIQLGCGPEHIFFPDGRTLADLTGSQ